MGPVVLYYDIATKHDYLTGPPSEQNQGEAYNVCDRKDSTYWMSNLFTTQTFEWTLPVATYLGSIVLAGHNFNASGMNITSIDVKYYSGGVWQTAKTISPPFPDPIMDWFGPIQATQWRVVITISGSAGNFPTATHLWLGQGPSPLDKADQISIYDIDNSDIPVLDDNGLLQAIRSVCRNHDVTIEFYNMDLGFTSLQPCFDQVGLGYFGIWLNSSDGGATKMMLRQKNGRFSAPLVPEQAWPGVKLELTGRIYL